MYSDNLQKAALHDALIGSQIARELDEQDLVSNRIARGATYIACKCRRPGSKS